MQEGTLLVCRKSKEICGNPLQGLIPNIYNYSSPKSKAKEHQELLPKRLAQWKDWEINKLLCEGRIIQSRIGKLRSTDPPDKFKLFTKLLLEGQTNSALRLLSESTSGGVLPLTNEVMAQIQLKHPNPQPAKSGSLLFGPIDDEFPESAYSGINSEMVRQAALRTKGSGGPSGVHENGFRRMLACNSFKQSSTKLCEAIAIMAMYSIYRSFHHRAISSELPSFL